MLKPMDSPNAAESPCEANTAALMGHTDNYSNASGLPSTYQQESCDASSNLNPGADAMPIELIPATTDPKKLLPCPVPLIEGLLEKQGVLILGGNSKSGKSFLVIELAIAIATGASWLGFPCRKGKVLYVNVEIEDSAFQHRVKDVAIARNVDDKILDAGVKILKRPSGFAWTMEDLTASLIARYRGAGFDLVIIDPIYMLLDGDESSSPTMRRFVSQVGCIVSNLKCAVALVHHRAKGESTYANVFDRTCGSGVLGRYVNTAIDISPLAGSENGMRAEIGTRSFAFPLPVDFTFEYPIYRLDETGSLATRHPVSSRSNASRKITQAAKTTRAVENAFDRLAGEDGEIRRAALVSYLNMDDRTVKDAVGRSDVLDNEKRGRVCWVTKQK